MDTSRLELVEESISGMSCDQRVSVRMKGKIYKIAVRLAMM